ncbi:hypothetical protein EDF35_1949 [Rathayibacter sp. PhB151]|uniref:hypothetical protein n=1 Tax=Rathayibacter sp. PhB151 TaxID=2485189 RepID=UPI0010639984|nr:hypothetical protein [Rathayibacter sp. PhB151]TDX78735.1 hypothetical protein EDF35_1949 [Rathayibacter sp. PhB151]
MSWSHARPPAEAVELGPGVAYSWQRCEAPDQDTHEHTINCLWVWHDCTEILGPHTVAPGDTFGWRPSGVSAHTLVQRSPLTITASAYWPDCCGLHGFITDGRWIGV